MKTLLLFILGTILLTLLFAYTKANLYSFWLGSLLCVVSEMAIFLVYALVKLHRAARDSQSIRL